MPVVNLLAIGGLAGIGVLLAVRHGLNPWWGLLLPLAVNAGLPLLRNLSDVVSTQEVAVLLTAWLFRWPWWSLALAAVATVFSREQNVPIVFFLVVLSAVAAPVVDRTVSLTAVLVVWGGWILVLWQMYGLWPFHPTQGAFDRPLAGLRLKFESFTAGRDKLSVRLVDGLCVGLILAQIGLLLLLIRRKADPAVVLVALFGAALALMGGDVFYCDFWSYSRVFAMLPLAVWIGCAQTRWRWPLALTATQFLVPLAVAGA